MKVGMTTKKAHALTALAKRHGLPGVSFRETRPGRVQVILSVPADQNGKDDIVENFRHEFPGVNFATRVFHGARFHGRMTSKTPLNTVRFTNGRSGRKADKVKPSKRVSF
jgi:hypothetical protein